MYDFTPEVSRGMAWCDQHFGREWIWRVDVETLLLSSCTDCVLGQLGGDYEYVSQRHDLRHKDAIHHGFIRDLHATNRDGYCYQALTAAWRRAILAERERRQVDVLREGMEGQPREGAVRVAG